MELKKVTKREYAYLKWAGMIYTEIGSIKCTE